jgi:hypothetical protein
MVRWTIKKKQWRYTYRVGTSLITGVKPYLLSNSYITYLREKNMDILIALEGNIGNTKNTLLLFEKEMNNLNSL